MYTNPVISKIRAPPGRLRPTTRRPNKHQRIRRYGAISENSVTSTEISQYHSFMERPEFLAKIDFEFELHPVVAILGPRQCGKTTLARMYADSLKDESVTPFDLEDPTHLARLETPKLALEDLAGLVIIDEIQRVPELFAVLRVLVDRSPSSARFLVLGGASHDLIRQSSETLAGRIGHIELTPFLLTEVGASSLQPLWIRGGFPRAFLAASDSISMAWRTAFISTFLERDIPALRITIPPHVLRRMWTMLAHYHGQSLNASELRRSFGAADTTVRRYIDLLCSTFMVRRLPPWFENIKKRQIKTPKIHIRDSGLFHALLCSASMIGTRSFSTPNSAPPGKVLQLKRSSQHTVRARMNTISGRPTAVPRWTS